MSLLKAWWRLGKPFWFSGATLSTWFLLGSVVMLTISSVYLLVQFNSWNQEFYDAVQKFDQVAFWQLMLKFCCLAAAYILAGVLADYWTGVLQNRWRLWMTQRYLDTWLSEKSHYLWQLAGASTDNPDQRISEDIRDYVERSLDLSLGILSQGATLVAFVGILWELSGPLSFNLGGHEINILGYMAWACLIYAVFGTWISQRIGRPLIFLNYQKQQVEADFRFGLVRLRENGESVALCDGEEIERNSLKRFFDSVYSNFRSLIRKQMHLGFFQSGYDQVAIIFPYLVASPRYFTKVIGLGGLFQTADAFGKVKDSLSWVVSNYDGLAYWRSVVERLQDFEGELERTKVLHREALASISEIPRLKRIEIKDLELRLPDGKLLAEGLKADFKARESLLISAPSGSGKSTFLRALSGIWPFTKGQVRIPAGQSLMVLPQKPYLPLGSLKSALCYPSKPEAFSVKLIEVALKACSLDGFLERLDEIENWSQILSLGEQQRVAWVRVFLHRPQWLFLDEATSALDEVAQEIIFKSLKKALPKTSVVSIAHTQKLALRHRRVWHFA